MKALDDILEESDFKSKECGISCTLSEAEFEGGYIYWNRFHNVNKDRANDFAVYLGGELIQGMTEMNPNDLFGKPIIEAIKLICEEDYEQYCRSQF